MTADLSTRWIAGFEVRAGRQLPFGATPVPGGVNFAVSSNHATAVTLVLFRRGEPEMLAELPFPEDFRVGGAWAMTVLGVDADDVDYGYRVDGPFDPDAGHRFDPTVVIADPYAKALAGAEEWGVRPGLYEQTAWRSRVVRDEFDWQDDRRPGIAQEDLVVYEAHVRGFTRHPNSGVDRPGTYAGLVEKIPYLQRLGVNCVELMPVFEFDEFTNSRHDPATDTWWYNYWGYSTVGFFAPKASFAAGPSAVDELKALVRELHKAGIEVVLDVVFNHTAEGNEWGPTISFRGLDNRTFYMLTPDGDYLNFSGTGNTVNCNDPVVRGFLLDCLRYWASEFHVDGFRFDLAAILSRGPDGSVLANPPLVEALAGDPVLRDCKLIAEAWDAAGLYQVGSFPGYRRFAEWNGRYRDALRRFVKGDDDVVGEMATRFVGSPDLYGDREPAASVNFVTAHDGFTLADLVAYNDKHNEANGEGGRDGDSGNHSWNSGVEGPTDDPDVLALRDRQVRNALLLLLTSQGVPMLLAGDEVGRTQRGNNNAYCHDSELSWFDWDLVKRNEELFEFTRRVIAFRAAHPALRRRGHLVGGHDVTWHGTRVGEPDWSPDSRLLAASVVFGDDHVYVAANAHWEGVELALPEGIDWRLFADTGAGVVAEPGHEPPLADRSRLWAGPRSVVVLTSRPTLQE
ncbi:glycogen debranching enzyme GlgX [Saccharothrix sp. ALI-22-I]|uniref:glycogen debranching protein GlgX n=1 Tax=Saccharothrix sp. ALI-22-I TaxID=1933778 RepID=UPI00097C3C63|nr:glycogen debranching protein GlgX [Saccharothrix sp. ALI-22-I]ONI84657.1 glycogen debranching enzyme GlgX [Saccharothrix sp. ALI-22-I]